MSRRISFIRARLVLLIVAWLIAIVSTFELHLDNAQVFEKILINIGSSNDFVRGRSILSPVPNVKSSAFLNTTSSNTMETSGVSGSSRTSNIYYGAYCARVFANDYNTAPQNVTINADGSQTYAPLQCTRNMEDQDGVKTISVVAQMLESDDLRRAVARLMCSIYYRPADAPSRNPCSSLCHKVISLMPPADGSPAERRDRAVIEALLYNTLLAGGYCDAAPFFSIDVPNEPTSCVGHANDTIFRADSETRLVRASCQRYPENGVCANMVSYVYSSPDLGSTGDLPPSEDISVAFREKTYGDLRNVYALAPVFPERCDIALAKYACSRLFMPCYEMEVVLRDLSDNMHVITYPVPQLTHRDACQEYATSCTKLIAQMTSINHPLALFFLADCDSNSPINARYDCNNMQVPGTGDLWHPRETYYESGLGLVLANNFTQDTQPMADAQLTFEPLVSCPAPLVTPTNPDTPNRLADGSCALPCPTIVFDNQDYHMVDNIVVFMAILGTVCISFLLLTFLTFSEKRHSLNVIPFLSMCTITSVAILLGVFALFRPSGDSMATRLCYTNSDQATMTQYPACAAQGFFILFGMLSLCAWWSISAFDLFIKIVLGVRISTGSLREQAINALHYVWGWGIPLALTIAAAATHSLGPADLDMTYCFVHAREDALVPWLTAYYPLMIYLLVGGFSMSATLYILCKATNKLQQTTGARSKDSWKHYASAISFILIFFLLFLTIIIYRAVAYFSNARWTESATQFVVCLLTQSTMLSSDTCGTKPDDVPNVGFWIFVQFVVAGCGFFSFLVYGINPDIYLLWAARLGDIFNIECCIRAGAHTHEGRKRQAQQAVAQKSESSYTSSKLTNQSSEHTKTNLPGASNFRMPGAAAKFRHAFRNIPSSELSGAGSSARRTRSSITLSHYATVLNTYRKGQILEAFNIADEDEILDLYAHAEDLDDEEPRPSKGRGSATETELVSLKALSKATDDAPVRVVVTSERIHEQGEKPTDTADHSVDAHEHGREHSSRGHQTRISEERSPRSRTHELQGTETGDIVIALVDERPSDASPGVSSPVESSSPSDDTPSAETPSTEE